jgi:serine/threonine-protein kinase
VDLEQFGPYRIESMLGRGGMGEVYRAFDTEHDRVVALKVLSEALAADSGYRERFRREAHLAARLNEPHIVPIHRYGEIEGRLFLDMRLVPGRDVAAVLAEEGPMDPARAVSIISQTARALDSAHADGLVHRDVKPSNVLVTGTGDDEFVYLVDFGIARSTSDAQGPALTQTGAALGSFDYMAPERFLEKPIDRRVDVYALACVLFECLTGRRPFTGDGLATLMYAHLNTEAQAPSALRPGLPKKLDEVVGKGLAKDPDERYATCGELAAAARAALRDSGVAEAVIPAAPPTSVTPLPPRPQTVGFSNPGYAPPSHPGPGGYGPPSSPGTGGYGPASNPGPGGYGPPSSPGTGGYGPPSSPGTSGYGPPTGGGYAPAAGTGGYGPSPTGGGGYGPPSNPGPPVFPPPGPSGTTGFGPGRPGGPNGPGTSGGYIGHGSSPSGARRKPNRLPIVLGAVAVLVVLAVVLVVVLVGGSDDGGGEAGPTTSGPVTTTSSSSSSTPPEDGPEDDLRAILPTAYDGDACETRSPAGDGDLAAISCGPSLTQPGPEVSNFYLYEDGDAAEEVFRNDLVEGGEGGLALPEVASLGDVPLQQGWHSYTTGEGGTATGGFVAVFVSASDQDTVLYWTQEDVGAVGVVSLESGGEAGIAVLWDWWTTAENSDFIAN